MPNSMDAKLEGRLAASEAREDFADTINKVCFGGYRIILHRRGRNLAAMVPMQDLMLLKSLEDRYDLAEARSILAKAETRREKPVSWEQLKTTLNLLPIKERRYRRTKGKVGKALSKRQVTLERD